MTERFARFTLKGGPTGHGLTILEDGRPLTDVTEVVVSADVDSLISVMLRRFAAVVIEVEASVEDRWHVQLHLSGRSVEGFGPSLSEAVIDAADELGRRESMS